MGGKEIEIDSVLLHSAAAVARWQNLLAQAQPLLGNFSTGIGIWGSPGVALAGAVALSFLEAAVTNANQKQGFHLLSEAYSAHERLKPRGAYIWVSEISGIETPTISNWKSRGEVPSELDVRSLGNRDRARVMNEYGATDAEMDAGFLVRPTTQELILLPDDFVTCGCDGRAVQIKWSAVETYEAVE